MAAAAPESFVVVVCTRNRPDQAAEALDILAAQEGPEFPIVVVDQSDEVAPRLREREAGDPRLTVIHDEGKGLSRARNLAWKATAEDWLLFVDDDCVPAGDFTAQFARTVAAHPEVDMITGHVGGRNETPRSDDMPFSTFPVTEERTLSGHWTHPSLVGFGVTFAVRRRMVDAVGGWDERLGPGAPDFPASDDMDFNLRVMRADGVSLLTPAIRAEHDQWRSRDEVVALYGGYAASWMGLIVKVLRGGDVRTAFWLWWHAVPVFLFPLVASGLKRRSRFRLRVAWSSLVGYAVGARKALQRSW